MHGATIRFITTTFTILAGSLSSLAQPLLDRPLTDEHLVLLNDRLRIRMPEGSRLEPRSISIMAADEAIESESRVVLESGGDKLVLMAHEMFAQAGTDMEKQVHQELQEWERTGKGHHNLERFDLAAGSLKAWTVTPANWNTAQDAIRLLGMFLVQKDNTVQYLSLYANPLLAKKGKRASDLARRIISTVRAGDRVLNLSPRRLRLDLMDHSALLIQLPAGYVSYEQRGPDFDIFHIQKIVPFRSVPTHAGIFRGNFPSYQHEQSETHPTVKTTLGAFLDQSVEWHSWSEPPNGSRREVSNREAISPQSDGDGYLHVFSSADNPEDLQELSQILDTMSMGASNLSLRRYWITGFSILLLGLTASLWIIRRRTRRRPARSGTGGPFHSPHSPTNHQFNHSS